MPRGIYTRKKKQAFVPPQSVSEAEKQVIALNQRLVNRDMEIARLHFLIAKYRLALSKHGDFTEIE